MQKGLLQRKGVLRAILLVLLLNSLGMKKMNAYDFSAVCETGQTLYYNIIDTTNHYVQITYPGILWSYGWEGYTKPEGDIALPESVQYDGISYIVTFIGGAAFLDCDGLTGSLTIGNSVTRIGDMAFYGCSGFTGSLSIGNSVTAIGDEAFYACNGFNGGLTIPNSVTMIGEMSFFSCSGFNGSLTIGNSVTSIGNYAFSGCGGFTGSLVIPNSMTMIGSDAFEGCSGFNGSLTIGNFVTTIGYEAFKGCSGFTGSLTIPNSVITIGGEAFSGCSGFTGMLILGNSVTEIGWNAFYGCSGLDLMSLPNSVISIGAAAFYGTGWYNDQPQGILYLSNCCLGYKGQNPPSGALCLLEGTRLICDYAFNNCSGFTGNLTIPNSVATIGNQAFTNCTGFTDNLIIGNSVTSIGFGAFAYCGDFDSVFSLSMLPPLIEGEYTFFECGNPALIVCCESKEAYMNSDWAQCFSTIEEDCNVYSILIEDNDLGEVGISVSSARLGEEVLVSCSPNFGYETDGIVVCNVNDELQIVPYHPISDSEYMFVMPYFDVMIKSHFSPLSVGEKYNDIAKVYPNPTFGKIRIEAKDLKHITISNMLGQQIYNGKATGNEFEYDFSRQKAGIYLVRIETANGTTTKRVVVTR